MALGLALACQPFAPRLPSPPLIDGDLAQRGGLLFLDASLSPDASEGTATGKRYVNEAGDLEVLCTKPGEGSLGCGEAVLQIKGAKPLPSSD